VHYYLKKVLRNMNDTDGSAGRPNAGLPRPVLVWTGSAGFAWRDCLNWIDSATGQPPSALEINEVKPDPDADPCFFVPKPG
jgi:hypothetical protein